MDGNFFNQKTLVWCHSDCEYSKCNVCTFKTQLKGKAEIWLTMICGSPSCDMYKKKAEGLSDGTKTVPVLRMGQSEST